MQQYINCIIYIKKIKFNSKQIQINRHKTYLNNLNWFLKYYKVIKNDLEFIKYSKHTDYSLILNIFNLFL